MLKKFSVENFKGFQNKITFVQVRQVTIALTLKLQKMGVSTKGIIYGINSSGKSNLGLAIFDIITHLTKSKNCFSVMIFT